MGLLEVGQIAVAILFFSPSTQDTLIKAAKLNDTLKSRLTDNITVSGSIFAAIAAFLGISLILVFVQMCTLDKGFDESASP